MQACQTLVYVTTVNVYNPCEIDQKDFWARMKSFIVMNPCSQLLCLFRILWATPLNLFPHKKGENIVGVQYSHKLANPYNIRQYVHIVYYSIVIVLKLMCIRKASNRDERGWVCHRGMASLTSTTHYFLP